MRLVGEQGIITIPATREEEELENRTEGVTEERIRKVNYNQALSEIIKTEEDSSSLPTSVLLQRIKVQLPSKQFQPTKARQDAGNAKRKRGRMVRRRRRKKNIGVRRDATDDIFETDASHESPVVPGVTDRVYFTPL